MADWLRRGRAAARRRGELRAAWRRLPRPERRAFLDFVWLIPAMRAGLRLAGFKRWYRWLDQRLRRGGAPPDAPERIARALGALQRARRYAPYRGNCLSQSLALWWRLGRAGVIVELCLGAQVVDGAFLAHAWVEHEGRILNDMPDVRARFAPLSSLSKVTWS